MADEKLSEKHLVAPRKMILLVRQGNKGIYEACTLSGDVVLSAGSRDEIKEKFRVGVKAMDASIRPTTVRLHFVAEARTWLMGLNEVEDEATPTQSKKKGKS